MDKNERRDFIKKAVIGGVGTMVSLSARSKGFEMGARSLNPGGLKGNSGAGKKVIVGGAGISGLCCAYELMKMGHEVIVMEASGRYGGAVLSVHDGLSDGLYADFGAENFTKPGYENYWKYIEEFDLPVLPYFHREDRLTRIDNEWLTDEMQRKRNKEKIRGLGGFNDNEKNYLSLEPSSDLEMFYLKPYFENFTDEYQTFGIGYDHLENIPVSEIYKKAGASKAALSILGGGKTSALYAIWQAFIRNKRGYDKSFDLFRLKYGNQTLTNELGFRLGSRVKLGCQILEVHNGEAEVTIKYREFGEEKQMTADFFASCLRTTALQKIPITPKLPSQKLFVFDNLAYDQTTRIIFQARSKFWLKDKLNINLTFNHPALRTIWQVADEVGTNRVALMAKAPGGTNPLRTLDAFKELYPGNKSNIDIEQVLSKDWSSDEFVHGCERHGFAGLGELSKYWPHLMTPHGRIHFGGAHTDNRSWGMEAATNAGNRVAREIENA